MAALALSLGVANTSCDQNSAPEIPTPIVESLRGDFDAWFEEMKKKEEGTEEKKGEGNEEKKEDKEKKEAKGDSKEEKKGKTNKF